MKLLSLLNLWPPFKSNGPVYEVIHYECLLYTQTVLRSIGLPGIDSANIVAMKVPWLTRAREMVPPLISGFPCVIITPWAMESMEGGNNRRDDIGYPCLVSFVDTPDNSLTANLSRDLQWRQMASDALRNQQPSPQIGSVWNVRVEPNQIAIPEAFLGGMWASEMVFRFVNKQARGVPA